MTPTPEPTPAPRKDAKFLMSQISSPHMSDLKVIENFLTARDAEKDTLIAELRESLAAWKKNAYDVAEGAKVVLIRAAQAEAALAALKKETGR